MSEDYLPPQCHGWEDKDSRYIVMESYEQWPRPEPDPEVAARFQNWLHLIKTAVPEKPIPLPLPGSHSTVSHEYR